MKVIVAGDFCPSERVADLLSRREFLKVLGEIKPIVKQSDYSIVNLECPIVVSDDRPIPKCGPNLRCTETVVEAINYVEFKCATLANNHIRDFGGAAVLRTANTLKQKGIDYVGVGENLEDASRVLYKEILGERIAIINCCEHEFSIATDDTAGANPLNPIKQFYVINEAQENADYVLVIVHGGHEHYQLPSPRMQEIYRFFVDCGADAVINHHQHCYSGYEVYKGAPIFYGLGNFCFDEKESSSNGLWNEGYMVMLTLGEGIQFELIPYNQCSEEPVVKLLHRDAFETKLEELNAIIADEEALKKHANQYYQTCKKQYINLFEPVMNRYYLALRNRGLLPSFVSNKRTILAENYISCESHRDKLLYYLNNKNNK